MWRKDKPKRDKYNCTKNSVKTQKPKKDSYRNRNISNREEKVREKPKRPTGKVRYNYSGTENKNKCFICFKSRGKCRPTTQCGNKTHNRWHRKD